jgi:hypothetical protein
MIEAEQFGTPQCEWRLKLMAFAEAADDLQSDDIESDEMIDYYAKAANAALIDFLLLPVNSPKAVLAKMGVFKTEEVHHWNSESFDEIWAALIEDMKRVAGWQPPSRT